MLWTHAPYVGGRGTKVERGGDAVATKPILINCLKLPFAKTLGVSHFALRLCGELSEACDLIFVVPDVAEFDVSPARPMVEEIAHAVVSADEADSSPSLKGDKAIEFRPHHFQERRFSEISIVICHDLHVFDIGWKYNNIERVRDDFRKNLLDAHAVVAEFPRTYYRLESVAGITLMNLYLTEAPLLLDTTRTSPINYDRTRDRVKLIFPGQFQRHKNHEVLIQALSEMNDEARSIELIFPGTSFADSHTDGLMDTVRRNGLEDSVVFAGRLTDGELKELYWKCDGVIVPSLAEGGAYVPLEAIAAGKPVAVNRIESAEQHLRAVGGDVLWFDASSPADTARALRELASVDVESWLAANRQARERISQLRWKHVADKWILLFRWLSGVSEKPRVQVGPSGWDIRYRT
jgi:glycosyltransferase involved in cell wall biosynthesis